MPLAVAAVSAVAEEVSNVVAARGAGRQDEVEAENAVEGQGALRPGRRPALPWGTQKWEGRPPWRPHRL